MAEETQQQVEVKVEEKAPRFADKYDYNVTVSDPGLKRIINLRPVTAPKSGGALSHERFGRLKVNIIDRLIGHLMVPGHKGAKHLRTSKCASGRYSTGFKVVEGAFQLISKDGKNPIETLVKAIENSAPREEVMSLLIAGQRLPKQVDTAPIRRVDLALRWIAQGTFQISHSGKKASRALYEVLTSAAQNLESSFPISKRIDTERQAGSNR